MEMVPAWPVPELEVEIVLRSFRVMESEGELLASMVICPPRPSVLSELI